MKRTAPSIASCFDFSSNCAYPPITSLASVNGPSMTETFPPESRTRVLCAVGASPPLPSIVPFLTASSLRISMASMSSLGGGPEFSPCLTSIMNFILISPFDFDLDLGSGAADLLNPGSIYATNEEQWNRQLKQFFFVASLTACITRPFASRSGRVNALLAHGAQA